MYGIHFFSYQTLLEGSLPLAYIHHLHAALEHSRTHLNDWK